MTLRSAFRHAPPALLLALLAVPAFGQELDSPQYQELDRESKRTLVWNAIKADPYPEGKLPTKGVVRSAMKAIWGRFTLRPTFDDTLDVRPARNKTFHKWGTSVAVRWETVNKGISGAISGQGLAGDDHPYTGVFKEGTVGMAEERRDAAIVQKELEGAERRGDYRVGLRMIEEFLRERGRFGDYGFKARSKTLRAMIAHLDAADEHRKAGREVDAVIEFEAATKIEPPLEDRAPEYVALRTRLLETLASDAKTGFAAKDYLRVVKATESLGRLRPLSGEAMMRLGVAHELLGNATQAQKVYLRVPEGTREYGASRRSIARIARASGDYTKARRHLEDARREAYVDAGLETEYAEVCELCKDHDAAVAAWNRVGILSPRNPEPFAKIAQIEEQRERWDAAAAALRAAIERSPRTRPQLLVRLANVLKKAGGRENVVAIYRDLLDLASKEPELVAFLGARPRIQVENWIRELDYVQRSKEWIPRTQFLEEQGWERHDGRWMRPREARLREVAERYRKASEEELRAFSDERYQSYAAEKRITKGMNRREVIRAWGFFDELTVLQATGDKVVFEQLNFDHSRKVYLRNGLVCYWSE